MKRILSALTVCTVLAGCVSLKLPDTTPVENATYQETIDVPGKSQQQLFEKSKQWLALTFVSSKKVIEYENAAEGRIIGNGSSVVYFISEGALTGKMMFPQNAGFTLVEDIKDGKVRMVVNNIRLSDAHGNGGPGIYAAAWEQLRPKLVELCSGLKTFLTSTAKAETW